MILKDISLKTPQENIVYDDVLLHCAEKGHGGEVLRLWESSQYFVVLGRICKEDDDVQLDGIKKNHIPVLRRSSGGGTVVQGKGCLNYSLILSKEKDAQLADLRKSYQIILGKVIEVLKNLNVEAEFFPISDIALKDSQKKISGNAQRRSKKYILHHGTLLYDFDLDLIEQYLKFPKDIPEYRSDRSHLDFVANISLSAEDIKSSFKKIFSIDLEETNLNDFESNILQEQLSLNKSVVNL